MMSRNFEIFTELSLDNIKLKIDHFTPASPDSHATIYFEIIEKTDAGEIRVGFCELRFVEGAAALPNGNVGYTVFPPYRGRHIGAKACKIMACEASAHGLTRLFITCKAENTASAKTARLSGACFSGYLDGKIAVFELEPSAHLDSSARS